MAQTIEAQITKLLDEYNHLAKETVEKASRKVSRDCAQTLRNTSPRRPGGGEYASSWSTKKIEKGMVTYNRKHYRLTHLLENGHVIKNGVGTYGRAPAYVHIEPAAEEASQEFEEIIRRELSR